MGDLNPEAVIRERLDEPAGNPLRDRIGLWISSSVTRDAGGAQNRHQGNSPDALPTRTLPSTFDRGDVASILQRRYVSAMQACKRLPVPTYKALTAIYFSTVNRIVPLLDEHEFNSAQTEGSSSAFLERAICLVAAKDHTAASHLRLIEHGEVMNTRQFCSELYKGLVAAMDADLEPDRLTRIRVLALMSLHCEGYEGAEAASLHLCQAIHQAQTVGLHLDRPDRRPADPLVQLFWCLWTLDKMHASIGGRPVLLADRDIGIEKPKPHGQWLSGAFGVWLAISDLLATVISFYRPSASNTSGWEEGFPAFEDIVGENTQGDLDFATLGLSPPARLIKSLSLAHTNCTDLLHFSGFLELFYHCVAILSCRQKVAESLNGTKVSSIRQGLAAVRIHSIVASECADRLPPHPIVPYAISLSMGVSYRQLRSSKLITHFDRAKASLEACCSLLEDLSSQWYSAEAMARLGRKALQQVDHEHQRHPGSERSLPHSVSGTAPTASVSVELVDANAASNQRETDGLPSIPPEADSMEDFDTTLHGFADIDTLFGEFLDLSLPTNFWDPIFAENEQNRSQLP